MLILDEKGVKLTFFGHISLLKWFFRIFRSLYWEDEISANVGRKEDNGHELQDEEEVAWSSKGMARDLARVTCARWHGYPMPGGMTVPHQNFGRSCQRPGTGTPCQVAWPCHL